MREVEMGGTIGAAWPRAGDSARRTLRRTSCVGGGSGPSQTEAAAVTVAAGAEPREAILYVLLAAQTVTVTVTAEEVRRVVEKLIV